MIIASKGHVRIKGRPNDVMNEYITIAEALMDEDATITPDVLKGAIVVADDICRRGMSTQQIKQLCGDIMIYLDKAIKIGLPDSSMANIDAAREILTHIYENPCQATECSESLYKIISGLHEICIYFELSAETSMDLAKRFASRLYDDCHEMRP